MFFVAKVQRQLRVSKYPLKEVKASGGCHGIGKELFVQAQSRFRTQLCQGIIDQAQQIISSQALI